MRKPYQLVLAGVALSLSMQSHATLMYNQNVVPDVIFGSGNANGSYTVDRAGGVELGLRGKLRHNASGAPENTFNSNGDGTYSFDAGVAPTQSSPTAVWSFEWSINSDYDGTSGKNLSDLSYTLGLDTDASAASSFLTFDPINGSSCADHSIGTNTTGNGAGVEASCPGGDALYASLIGTNNVAQNSWKPHWFISGFDPTVDGQYDIYLAAFDGGAQVARTDISIIVGNGVAVPAPAPIALFALGLGFLGFGARRSRSKR